MGAWLTEGASRLAGAFADAGIDAPVWNPSGDSRSGTQFWLRRVFAETVIHRADAAATADVAYDVDAELAADVITDHLDMMTSPGWAAMVPESAEALRGSGQTLHLHAGDAGDWFIERGPDGATWRHGDGDADVTVSGPATSLLLVLTRRRPIGRTRICGYQAIPTCSPTGSSTPPTRPTSGSLHAFPPLLPRTGHRIPAVFWRLDELRPGDPVTVRTRDRELT